MNRIDRLTAMLIQLQTKRIVRAQEIADRFAISLRTVYRDIRALGEAGVPVIGEAGQGYSLQEGYRLPPVMFTREEATAFLTAEKLVEKFTDPATDRTYKSAMFKVRAVLRGGEKDQLEHMENHIQVLRNYLPLPGIDGVLQALLQGASERRVMHLRYRALQAAQPTERDIEPVGVFFSGGYWHALAYCRLRGDYRDFRSDRMERLTATGQHFTTVHPSLRSFLDRIAGEQNLEKAVIRVEARAARFIQNQKYFYGFVSEQEHDQVYDMTFLVPGDDGFLRWLMSFGDQVTPLEPASLRERFARLLQVIQQRHPSSGGPSEPV
ncbi:MAG TPA: YafY family protein [Chitinophagaceae bacterium]|nr:YafY family protein [Chitinophagaceae bacterium]